MSALTYTNIFDAITDNPEEANELQTRADLMLAIREIIQDNNWKQKEASQKLGLTQPRLSDLVNGKIDKFSIDLLMTCLYRVGFRFQPRYENHQLTMNVVAVSG